MKKKNIVLFAMKLYTEEKTALYIIIYVGSVMVELLFAVGLSEQVIVSVKPFTSPSTKSSCLNKFSPTVAARHLISILREATSEMQLMACQIVIISCYRLSMVTA